MTFYPKKIKLQTLGRLLFALFLLVPSLVNARLPDGVVVSISSVKSEYSALEPILIKVRYTNTSDQVVSFLKWNTALEGRVNSDFLAVNGGVALLPYVGRQYKRAAPTAQDHISINSGAYQEATVDILDAYELNSKGRYLIEYRATQNATIIKQQGQEQQGTSDHFTLMENRPIRTLKRTPTFQDCLGGRPSTIDSAVAAAESLARRARDDLQNTPVRSRSSADRYRVWFGVYEAGRWNTAQDHFNRINSALSGRTLNFICDDTDSAFAYVYPSQPYNIYLGRAFWSAPRTGTDSKAGTIIHELSHFTVLGGTDDHVYGQSGARSLAINNPGGAVGNADSHEYFAENTPALSMPRPAPPEPPKPPQPPVPTPAPAPPPFLIQILQLLLVDEN